MYLSMVDKVTGSYIKENLTIWLTNLYKILSEWPQLDVLHCNGDNRNTSKVLVMF